MLLVSVPAEAQALLGVPNQQAQPNGYQPAQPNGLDQQGVNVPIQQAPAAALQGANGPDAVAAAPDQERRPAFTFVPTASIQGTFTDNVNLSATNTKSDWITTPSGGFTFGGKSERVQIAGDYSVSGDIYAENSQLNGYRQNLLTVDRFEPVKNVFAIDLRASVDEDQIAQTGVQAATQRTGLANQTQVANATITPSYTEKWGNWAISTLSYSLNEVAYFNAGNTATANNLNDSTQQSLDARLASGSLFARMTWDLALSDSISRGTNTHLTQQTAEADAEYRIDSTYRVPVTVGYDNFSDIQSGFAPTALSGVFWNTGIHLVPGPRTDLTLRYGRRYDKPYESGALTYKILPNVQLTANYDIAVQTQQQTLAGALQGVTVDANGALVNPIGGLPAAPNQTGNNLVNAVYRARTFQFGLNGTHGQNFFSLVGQDVSRDFGGTQGSDRTEAVTGTLGRTIGPLTTVSLTLEAGHTVDTATVLNTGTTNNLLAGVNLGYKLSDKTDLSFDVTRRQQSGATKSDEDAFVVQLSHRF